MALPDFYAAARLPPFYASVPPPRTGPSPAFRLLAPLRRMPSPKYAPFYSNTSTTSNTLTSLGSLHNIHYTFNNPIDAVTAYHPLNTSNGSPLANISRNIPSAPSATSSQPSSVAREDSLSPYCSPVTSPDPEELPIPIFKADSSNVEIAAPKPVYGYSHVPDIEAALEAFNPFRTSTPAYRASDGHSGDLNTLEGVPGHVGIVAHGPRLHVASNLSEDSDSDNSIPSHTVNISTELRDDDNDEVHTPEEIQGAEDLPKPIEAPRDEEDILGLGPVMEYLKNALFGDGEGDAEEAEEHAEDKDDTETDGLKKAKSELVQFVKNLADEICDALEVEKYLVGFVHS